MSITWSESDDELDNKQMAFTRKYDSYSESSDEKMSTKEFVETYREILTEWKKYCLREKKQKKTISGILLEK